MSEVLYSNGSTSQASICGSTLALMDAGVPIKAPVAGISCGLVTEGDRFMTMVDIQGLEDFFGDMDFKVGGTHKGITAIQMDLKVHGLTPAIIKEALEKTNYNQTELAQSLGTSQFTVSAWVRGDRDTTVRLLLALEDLTGMTFRELFGECEGRR